MSVSAQSSAAGFATSPTRAPRSAPAIVVVHGPNGAGKTNLLEAIYFGLTGRSFRAGNDRDMIRFGEQRRARRAGPGGERRRACLRRSTAPGSAGTCSAGRPLSGDPDQRPLVSVFHPDRLQLVKGSPAHRRAHLDRFVRRALARPGRPAPPLRPHPRPAQRPGCANQAGTGEVRSPCAAWDERLAAEAEPLIAARAEAVDALAGTFTRARRRASGFRRPRSPIGRAQPGIASELAAELARRRAR